MSRCTLITGVPDTLLHLLICLIPDTFENSTKQRLRPFLKEYNKDSSEPSILKEREVSKEDRAIGLSNAFFLQTQSGYKQP